MEPRRLKQVESFSHWFEDVDENMESAGPANRLKINPKNPAWKDIDDESPISNLPERRLTLYRRKIGTSHSNMNWAESPTKTRYNPAKHGVPSFQEPQITDTSDVQLYDQTDTTINKVKASKYIVLKHIIE